MAHVAQDVADELEATAAQVALAWTMAHSRTVHPIPGVRRLDQLLDNLGVLDVVLPPEALQRLDAVSRFDLGCPPDFIRGMKGFVFGEAGALVDR